MTYLFDSLEKTLRSEKSVCEKLLNTSQELKKAVLIGDISMINIWMEKTQVLIKESKALDEERETVVNLLAESLGYSYAVTLSELATHVDKVQEERLLLLMDDINQIMTMQKNINGSIYKLSRARLGVMDNVNHIIYRAAGLTSSLGMMREAVYRKEI